MIEVHPSYARAVRTMLAGKRVFTKTGDEIFERLRVRGLVIRVDGDNPNSETLDKHELTPAGRDYFMGVK